MDTITTITQKGQVTIPASFRQRLGLETGSKVKFEYKEDKELIVKPALDFASLRGYFKSTKKYSKSMARQQYLKNVLAGKV